MSVWSLLLTIAILGVAYYMGWLRPTGLGSRTRAQQEREGQDEAAQKWLDKDGK
jgi:hypothetical protein